MTVSTTALGGVALGPGIPARLRAAMRAAERGQGGMIVLEADHTGQDPQAVVEAAAAGARARGWAVAVERGAALDRARPLSLTGRLIAAAGAEPGSSSETAARAAERLERAAAGLASTAPSGAALLGVVDAQLASRACLRVLGNLPGRLPRHPVVVVVAVGERVGDAHPLHLRLAAPDGLLALLRHG